MAEHVDWCIMEAVQAATGVDFDVEATNGRRETATTGEDERRRD